MEIPTFIVIFIGSIHSRDGTSVSGQWDISYSGVGHQEGGKGRKFHLSRIQRKGTSVINKRWDIKTELGPVFYTRLDIGQKWDLCSPRDGTSRQKKGTDVPLELTAEEGDLCSAGDGTPKHNNYWNLRSARDGTSRQNWDLCSTGGGTPRQRKGAEVSFERRFRKINIEEGNISFRAVGHQSARAHTHTPTHTHTHTHIHHSPLEAAVQTTIQEFSATKTKSSEGTSHSAQPTVLTERFFLLKLPVGA